MKPILLGCLFLYAAWISCPAHAQSIAGTLTAADTGAPMAGATVLAIQKSTSQSAAPVIYRSVVDSSGNYAIAASPGQYALCVHPMPTPKSPYLDPCQWGSPVTVTAGTSAVATVSLSLQKGVLFIVRGDSLVRDYGTVIPINIPMSVTISSETLTLADSTGAPLGASAMPFQVLPTDAEVTGTPSAIARGIPAADAKMIHVYTTALTGAAGQAVIK